MTPASRPSEQGVTVVETVLSVSILVALSAGIFGIVLDAEGVFSTSLRANEVRENTVRSFGVLKNELRQANPDTLTIDDLDPSGDIVEIEVPLRQDGADIVWGANGQDGFRWRFLLAAQPNTTDMQYVRRLIDDGGAAVGEDQVLARNVMVDGGKGVTVTRVGSVLNVSLRLRFGREVQENHDAVARTQTVSVRLRSE